MVKIIDYRRDKKGRRMYMKRKSRLWNYFTKREIVDLLVSWIVLSLAYSFAFSGGIPSIYTFIFLPLSMATSALTFISHELAHKFVARKYGAIAHYQANYYMLILCLLISMTGYLFFAGGAVMIQAGYITRRENGIIAAAGPLINIIIAAVFFPFTIVPSFTYFYYFSYFLFAINAWVAVWNLLPFFNHDGKKILPWNMAIFITMLCAAIILVVLSEIPWYCYFGACW
ncbi:MAG: hypothetical protein ACTSUE_18435 [Promethearchaeota archaeon]